MFQVAESVGATVHILRNRADATDAVPISSGTTFALADKR